MWKLFCLKGSIWWRSVLQQHVKLDFCLMVLCSKRVLTQGKVVDAGYLQFLWVLANYLANSSHFPVFHTVQMTLLPKFAWVEWVRSLADISDREGAINNLTDRIFMITSSYFTVFLTSYTKTADVSCSTLKTIDNRFIFFNKIRLFDTR